MNNSRRVHVNNRRESPVASFRQYIGSLESRVLLGPDEVSLPGSTGIVVVNDVGPGPSRSRNRDSWKQRSNSVDLAIRQVASNRHVVPGESPIGRFGEQDLTTGSSRASGLCCNSHDQEK